MPQAERIQKILARSGYGSRRACEELIKNSQVSINDETAKLGSKAVADKDIITVDGNVINQIKEFIYIKIYKPRGFLSTKTLDRTSKSVFDLVNVESHLFTVGRLDKESEGLMLLTNDGELTNILTHPRYHHQKEYRVHILRHASEEQIKIWRSGVTLDDGYRTKPAAVSIINHDNKGTWIKIIMSEGKKRQIRRVGECIGLSVDRIIRTRIGNITLGKLKPGEWNFISRDDIKLNSKS